MFLYLDVYPRVVTHPLWRAGPRSRGRWCPRWRSRCSRWNLEQNPTNWENGKERAAPWRDVTQTRRQKEVEEIKLWVTRIASTAKKKLSRLFAREPDLPGWCRCEGSRGTELPLDSLGPRRRPPASSRPGRGWSRWTCHPLRHTPPCAGEPKKKKIISHRVDGGVRGGGSWHRNLFLRELNLRFVFLLFWCCMCHHEGFYWTAKFCPAKGSVLVIWRPLWSSSVADKNRNLQQELLLQLESLQTFWKKEQDNKIFLFLQFWGDWKVNHTPSGALSAKLVPCSAFIVKGHSMIWCSHPSSSFSSASFLRWSLAWLAYSVTATHNGDITVCAYIFFVSN